ncbi:MAG: hypothetical protein AB4038_10555 [Prochloraceae cyanobacterium]
MNFYTIYRLILLLITLYGLLQLTINLFKYKPYYEKIPVWMKNYIFHHGGKFLWKKLGEHRRDLIINGLLLAMLVFLDILAFIY